MAPAARDAAGPSAGFVAVETSWCSTSVDTQLRELPLSASMLEAWRLTAAAGRPDARGLPGVPHTEADVRGEVCGGYQCTLAAPQLIRAHDGERVGYALWIPTDAGLVVAPVDAQPGACPLPPELSLDHLDERVHARIRVARGRYAQYYFHGGLDGAYGYAESYGGCEVETTVQIDLVLIPETATLELSLTQEFTPDQQRAPVELQLREQGEEPRVQLEGCGDLRQLRPATPADP